jgi:hypothetical protein
VVKRRWKILVHPPEFDMDVQARILPALATIHNLILKHDPQDAAELDDNNGDPLPGQRASEDYGQLGEGPASDAEKAEATAQRDRIAQAMWDDYQELLCQRGEDDEDLLE